MSKSDSIMTNHHVSKFSKRSLQTLKKKVGNKSNMAFSFIISFVGQVLSDKMTSSTGHVALNLRSNRLTG